MSYRICLAIGVLLLVSGSNATNIQAQTAQEMHPAAGAWVRLKAPPSHRNWVTGTFSGYAGKTLAIAPDSSRMDSLLVFGRDQVAEFEVYRGRKSAAGKGAVVGLLFGAAAGISLGLAGCQGLSEDCVFDADGVEVALIFGAVLGAAGAGIGSLIGLAVGTDDWEPVPLEGLRVSIRPNPAGRWAFSLSATLSD